MGKKSANRDLLFVDVETTGLRHEDRVVSLGLVRIDGEAHADGQFNAKFGHYIFNPGRRSDPRARKVHGYSDELLAEQDAFADLAGDLGGWFEGCAVVAAHNAPFDRRFIFNEFEAAGRKLAVQDIHCTMKAFKAKTGGRGGLDVALETIGLNRQSRTHGALEDAWLAANVHFWTAGSELLPNDRAALMPPINLRQKGSAATIPPVHATLKWATDQRERLERRAGPTAMMMAYLAAADGVDPTEVAVLADYVGGIRQRLGIPESESDEQDLAAQFFQTELDEQALRRVATAVMSDAEQKSELLPWLKLVGYADGKLSDHEVDAIAILTRAVKDALESSRAP